MAFDAGSDSRQASKSEAIYPMRLQKFLARAGVASRRGSENLMTAGRVRVNGEVVTELGSKVDPNVDVVEVDGQVIRYGNPGVYILLNKPEGYVSTMSDPHARLTVAQLVPTSEHPGLFPVGRLDMDTTGVLLFMTDGELGHLLLSPRHKVEKRYEAIVDGRFTDADRRLLEGGIELDDGMTLPAKVTIDAYRNGYVEGATQSTTTAITCILTEGRKRQVKRMLSAVGHPVLKLHRSQFGPIGLDGLAPGEYRELTSDEVDALRASVK